MKKIFNKSILKFLFIFGIIFISANICNATAVSVTVYADPTNVSYGGGSTISWISSGATACSESGGRGGNGTTGSFYVTGLTATTTFTVTCSGYTAPASCPSYYPVCFVADTIITMADGLKKNIQDVKIGDILKGEKTNNIVLGFHNPKLEDRKLYSFNGGRYFVTAEHPFKTIDGWKILE